MFGRMIGRALLGVAVLGVLAVGVGPASARGGSNVCPKPSSPDRMLSGNCLHKGESIMSPNQKYALKFKDDGNLVLLGRNIWTGQLNRVLWQTHTAGQGGLTARFGPNTCVPDVRTLRCAFTIASVVATRIWTAAVYDTYGSLRPAELHMENSGMVVAYGKRSDIPNAALVPIWFVIPGA